MDRIVLKDYALLVIGQGSRNVGALLNYHAIVNVEKYIVQ